MFNNVVALRLKLINKAILVLTISAIIPVCLQLLNQELQFSSVLLVY